jgi:two-component system chemotaxis sensor kinase CheA
MDMSQYLEIFIDESKEHLQHMNKVLLELEGNQQDINLINEIFRVAHTIKGMAGTMGFNRVANLTHEMENVLHLVRNKEIPVSSPIIDILFECFDALEEYITNLSNTGQEGTLDTTSLVERLKHIAKTKSASGLAQTPQEDSKVAAALTTQKPLSDEGTPFHLTIEDISSNLFDKANLDGFNTMMVRVALRSNCMLKAARSFIVFNTLEQFGEVIKSYPSAEDIEDENFETSFELLYLTKLDAETIKAEIINISEIDYVEAVPVNVATLIQDIKNQGVQEAQVVSERTAIDFEKQDRADENAKESGQGGKAKTSKTVRVDIDRLDNLMNLVSELIIIKTRLEDLDSSESKQNMSEAVEYLERITTSLHDAVMKVRMVPVERTFNRFPRMVRDLAKDLGKTIKLDMTGEETEVDRTVIDEIGDPLIHLIRNSIDHGIESREERIRVGKTEAGTVALRAYPDGNTVVIEIEDDGHGINTQKVADKAISKGLITKAEAENMSQNEIVNLLFRPGFSTAEQITDLSGRGVGLDVVKTKIEALGGIVEVQTELGAGSKFIIRLPLTLAIIQALMVNLGNERYALPLNNIRIITTIKADSISRIQNQEVVLYRNQTLPLIRLPQILEVPNHLTNQENLTVVIVKKGNQEAGLIIDNLIGQQEIVIKSLGKYLTGIKAIAGATILGNGSVALIVDPNQLF